MSTLTSREFNQQTHKAKKMAAGGPVFITERGKAAHVLLKMEDYLKLTGKSPTLKEALSQSGNLDFNFDPPKISFSSRVPDFS